MAVAEGHAASIVYNFNGGINSPSGVPPGVGASDIQLTLFGLSLTLGTIGNPAPSAGPFSNTGASGSTYSTFIVSPSPGNVLNLVSFSFDEENIDAFGPANFDVYTSVDGFASSILTGSLSASAAAFSNHSVALAGLQYQDLSSPFEVRISGFGGPANPQSVWLFDNVSLNFEVAAVPEMSALGFLAAGASLIVVRSLIRSRGCTA